MITVAGIAAAQYSKPTAGQSSVSNMEGILMSLAASAPDGFLVMTRSTPSRRIREHSPITRVLSSFASRTRDRNPALLTTTREIMSNRKVRRTAHQEHAIEAADRAVAGGFGSAQSAGRPAAGRQTNCGHTRPSPASAWPG